MNVVIRTMGYFLTWGTFYGVVLGAWSTTLMMPLLGTFLGMLWGGGIGAACGLLCGLTASLVQAFTFHPEIDLPRYRLCLGIGLGVLVGITAPILLVLTTESILWGGKGYASMPVFLGPSLIAVIFWGGLCAAFIGHGYPFWLSQATIGKKHLSDLQAGPLYLMFHLIKVMLHPRMVWMTLGLGAFVGIAISRYYFSSRSSNDLLFTHEILDSMRNALGGAVIGFIFALVLCFGNAALVVFLRRVLFCDDTLSSVPHNQRVFLTGAAVIFTGLICTWPMEYFGSFLSWGWILPLLCAGIAGFYVYRALGLDHTDKAKRKAKESL